MQRFRNGLAWLNKKWSDPAFNREKEANEFNRLVTGPLDAEWAKLAEAERINFLRNGPRVL